MRIDPVKQFAKLQQQLIAEKARLESRLAEINEALGAEPTSSVAPRASGVAPTVAAPARGGRRARGKMSAREYIAKALSEKGPLSRSELGKAVLGLGYKSKAKDPLGSLGVVLYAKNSPFKRKNGKFYMAEGQAPAEKSGNNGSTHSSTRKKRVLSPEGRARIAAAARARWARQRAS